MADSKITDLSAIVTIATDDVLPIVDISDNETKKISIAQIKSQITKTDIGLGNVDNTSDLNKPISTATQTALDGKQSTLGFTPENVANKSTSIVTDQASNTKYPSVKSVYDWAIGIFQLALGYTPANKAGDTFTGSISATNLSGTNTGDNATNSQYSGLAASKQDTLVSGTNIKTINSTSLLGSGNITISASASGIAGAIQFSDGTNFTSDATTLFFNNTNKRLGVGLNSPSSRLHIRGDGTNPIARFDDNLGTEQILQFENTGRLFGQTTNSNLEMLRFQRNANRFFSYNALGKFDLFTDAGGQPGGDANYKWINFSHQINALTSGIQTQLALDTAIAISSGNPNIRVLALNYTINNTASTSGAVVNGIFINATETSITGTTHNLMDLQRAGVSQFRIDRVGAFSCGNTVAAAVGVSSTHKVTVVIGGVTYFLLASNV